MQQRNHMDPAGEQDSSIAPPATKPTTGTNDGAFTRTGLLIIRSAAWFALLIGVLGAVSAAQPAYVAAASLCSGVFVIPVSLIKAKSRDPTLTHQLLALFGALLTVAATTLTGGIDSPFLLLALMPALYGAMVGGVTLGLGAALLSAGVISAVELGNEGIDALLARAGSVALFPLVALVVAQIRSLLIEAEDRATTLVEATAAAEAELERLSQTNQLLRRLTDVYGSQQSNPVEVGRSVLEAIVDGFPGSFATATLFDSNGPVVVARAGTDSRDLVRRQFSLNMGDSVSGVVSVASPYALTIAQANEIENLLRPVAVSFANAQMLQGIAAEAVAEERLRLARELHDEIGPALAALGLSLDSASLVETAEARRELPRIREGLGVVVDDIRGIIADLRSERSIPVSRALADLTSTLTGRPEINLRLRERRLPRGAAERQILAIVTEAVRNAHRHSGGSTIFVSGSVDSDSVDIVVKDDGSGFRTTEIPDGHFGVMGMKERADRIGAQLEIDSGSGGSTVHLRWKDKP